MSIDIYICSMRYTITYLSEWQKYKNLTTLNIDKIQDFSYDACGNFIVFIQLVSFYNHRGEQFGKM